MGVHNQALIINGVLTSFDDTISESLYNKQQKALSDIPTGIQNIPAYFVPLRAYNITGMENVRNLLVKDNFVINGEIIKTANIPNLSKVIDDLYASDKKVIFTMGKGGVGKTSIAAAIALGLSAKGKKVHLTTTDPAAHLKFVMKENNGIAMSHIDEKAELKRYQDEVLAKARETMSEEDVAYVEEDLRSPYTQGDIPEAVKKLLPRLRNADETEVIIVTLAETTPVYEAMRLEDDLKRAGIAAKWWIINSSLYVTDTNNLLLKAKASHEVEWMNKVDELSNGNFAVIKWSVEDIKGNTLLTI